MSTGWSLLCEDANHSIQTDIGLLVVILVVLAAVAVMIIIKMISNQSSSNEIMGFVVAFIVVAILITIGIQILSSSMSNCSFLPGASVAPSIQTQSYGPSTEFILLSSENDDQYSNLNQDNPDGWTLLDHNPTTIPFSGNLMNIVGSVTFNNMTHQENVNIFIGGLDVAQPIQIPAGSTGDFSDGTCFHVDEGDEVKLHATGTLDAANKMINLKVTSLLTSADCP